MEKLYRHRRRHSFTMSRAAYALFGQSLLSLFVGGTAVSHVTPDAGGTICEVYGDTDRSDNDGETAGNEGDSVRNNE